MAKGKSKKSIQAEKSSASTKRSSFKSSPKAKQTKNGKVRHPKISFIGMWHRLVIIVDSIIASEAITLEIKNMNV